MDDMKVTERGGINPKASDNSKDIIKTLYYIMKHNKVFYQFQRSFLPLSGLNKDEEAAVNSRICRQGQHYEIDDYLYFPVPRGIVADAKYVSECPKVIRDIICLNRMLMIRDRDSDEPVPYMAKDKVIGYYVSYVLSNKRGRKLPTSVVVENAFGVFGLLLFTVLFFVFLASISKAIAIGTGFMLFFFGTIALLGIWNHH